LRASGGTVYAEDLKSSAQKACGFESHLAHSIKNKHHPHPPIAQLVEQGPLKPKVPGSSPGGRTNKNMKPTLIVIDCQNDFIKDASSYEARMLDEKLIGRIGHLIQWTREQKLPIIYTQHSIKPDKSNEEFGEPKNVRACIIDTKGWGIIDSLKPRDGETVIQKNKYDAFYQTNLEEKIKKTGADTLILCGVLTNNCVRATAEGAHYRNFKLVIVSDCCGGTSYLPEKTDEEIHDITLRDLQERMYETKIALFKDLSKVLQNT
jgi:nicotinamidase-related amidase